MMWGSPAMLDGRTAAAVPRPPTRPPTQPQAPRLATVQRAAAHPAPPEVGRATSLSAHLFYEALQHRQLCRLRLACTAAGPRIATVMQEQRC